MLSLVGKSLAAARVLGLSVARAVPVSDAVPYAVLLELPSAAVSLLPYPQATTGAKALRVLALAVTSPWWLQQQ